MKKIIKIVSLFNYINIFFPIFSNVWSFLPLHRVHFKVYTCSMYTYVYVCLHLYEQICTCMYPFVCFHIYSCMYMCLWKTEVDIRYLLLLTESEYLDEPIWATLLACQVSSEIPCLSPRHWYHRHLPYLLQGYWRSEL